MKTINDKLQKHTLIAALLATTLAGCDGQEAKTPEEAVATPKLAETKQAPSPVKPATPSPAPAVQAQPVMTQPPAKPEVILSNDKSGLVNIARGKPTKQSSDAYGAFASRAVDGNVDGSFFNSSVTHTQAEPSPWIEIDLGESENIDHIIVWNRTDCCSDRLKNYWIFISDKPFQSGDKPNSVKAQAGVRSIKGGVANPSFVTKDHIGHGRYVRIQLDAKESGEYLNLAEVEIFRAQK
jgi:hypothetical protein